MSSVTLRDLYAAELHDLMNAAPATGSRVSNPESRLPNPENELMIARGPSTSLGAGDVPDSGDVNPRSTEQPKTTEPRIERYRDR